MSSSSSYTNAHLPEALDDEAVVVVDADARFHRTPIAEAFQDSRDRVAACDLERGHILEVVEKRMNIGTSIVIKCINCEAEWVDEGF